MAGNPSQTQVAIVGGGIAGLVAATELARGGAKVRLFESAATLGGRARTREQDGFFFNQGAHALYIGGDFNAALKRLGVATPGQKPKAKYYALNRGKLDVLPYGLRSVAESGLLGVRDKIKLAGLLSTMGGHERPAGSLAGWLDAQRLSPTLRNLVEAFVRLSTYAHAPAEMSAAAVLDQLKMAGEGVIYVDGGWSTLIDGLAAVARAAGADLVTGASVVSVIHEGESVRLNIADGSGLVADAALLALGPQEAKALFPAPSLTRVVAEARPARANVLDLGLARLPPGAHSRVQGVDRPLYLAMHSDAAKLAPDGAALVHIARYLAPGEEPAPDAIAELEAFADLCLPGWRALELRRQRLVGMPVTHGIPRWDVPRPDVALPDAPGVFIAGDWVGPVGMISDAAAASGTEAAARILKLLANRTASRSAA